MAAIKMVILLSMFVTFGASLFAADNDPRNQGLRADLIEKGEGGRRRSISWGNDSWRTQHGHGARCTPCCTCISVGAAVVVGGVIWVINRFSN